MTRGRSIGTRANSEARGLCRSIGTVQVSAERLRTMYTLGQEERAVGDQIPKLAFPSLEAALPRRGHLCLDVLS